MSRPARSREIGPVCSWKAADTVLLGLPLLLWLTLKYLIPVEVALLTVQMHCKLPAGAANVQMVPGSQVPCLSLGSLHSSKQTAPDPSQSQGFAACTWYTPLVPQSTPPFPSMDGCFLSLPCPALHCAAHPGWSCPPPFDPFPFQASSPSLLSALVQYVPYCRLSTPSALAFFLEPFGPFRIFVASFFSSPPQAQAPAAKARVRPTQRQSIHSLFLCSSHRPSRATDDSSAFQSFDLTLLPFTPRRTRTDSIPTVPSVCPFSPDSSSPASESIRRPCDDDSASLRALDFHPIALRVKASIERAPQTSRHNGREHKGTTRPTPTGREQLWCTWEPACLRVPCRLFTVAP